MSFFIQSKLGAPGKPGDLVVDIQGGKNTRGTLLDAFTKKTSAQGNANQLWEFVPGPADGYCFIQNPSTGFFVDIQGANTAPGSHLDVYGGKSFPSNANQLWAFYPAPTSGYYLIASLLNGSVIDVQGGKNTPGTLLDAYTQTGNDNQLWTFVDTNGKSVTPPAAPTIVPEPSGGYHGAGNYILAAGSKCATLTGVKATIYFTEDLVWEAGGGSNGPPAFSIQLNAETNSNQKLDWLQFMTHMGDDQGLWPWINIWAPPDANTFVWNQPVSNPVAKMPQAARIPAGYSIIVSLQNDSGGNVTGATWNVLDSSGASIGSVTYPLSTALGGGVPPGDLCPIASFQVTFGGASNKGHATFSSGAGLMVLEADQIMNVDTAYPSCIGFTGGTAETSNVAYGPMSATPSKIFAQAFNVAADSPQAHVTKPNARTAPLPRQR
jgi:hypothetical protein